MRGDLNKRLTILSEAESRMKLRKVVAAKLRVLG
jgi:hypothetical protein